MTEPDTDSITLPSPRTVIEKQLKRIARTQATAESRGRWFIAAGLLVAVVIIVASATGPIPGWVLADVLAASACAIFVGALQLASSTGLRAHLAHYHAFRFELDEARAAQRRELDELRVELEEGCRQFVSGIDTVAIARLAGQLQTIELVLPGLTAAVELNRKAMAELRADMRQCLAAVRSPKPRRQPSPRTGTDGAAVGLLGSDLDEPGVVDLEDVRRFKRLDERLRERRPDNDG
jgi:hypothetical protein